MDLQYLVPLERVAEVVAEHRAFLDEGYKQGAFLASGPKNPKTGGLVLARAESLEALQALLADDPFKKQSIASYHFTEFEPAKHHSDFGAFFTA